MDLGRIRQRPPAGWLLPTTCAIALLHFGQDVLEPLTLAAILSLAMAPLVRAIRRLGLPRGAATIAAVTLVGSVLLAVAAVLALQLGAVAADLPKYRAGLLAKIEQVRAVTVRPIEKWRAELLMDTPRSSAQDRIASRSAIAAPGSGAEPGTAAGNDAGDSPASPLPRILGVLWRALTEFGVVLVLLVFMLLDPDGFRDRLLRLAGRAGLAPAVQALEDAASGVSRFFLAQIVVNLCFGTTMAAALWLIGVPHAVLFGALAGVLRFLPYVGIVAAGIAIAGFTAAVDPGWSLVVQAAGVLVAAELVLANAIEPRLYGHSSGLAPVAVIVSALFWSAVWGPVGLVLATPLTLCLVVMGRHVQALEPIAIFFGDSPGITQGERLYHRALAGDLRDIHEHARAHLRRRSFASYCDHVLLPAIALARADGEAGRIEERRLQALRRMVVPLVESLTVDLRGRRKRAQATVLEANLGLHLRRMRESRLGRWQGPLQLHAGDVVLCASVANEQNELEAELLVRALSHAGVDARSVTVPHHADAGEVESRLARRISIVLLSYPTSATMTQWRSACSELRAALPRAVLAAVRMPLDSGLLDRAVADAGVDLVFQSFSEAVAFARPDPADRIATQERPRADGTRGARE